MVHWKGMLGLVRFRMLRASISKYSTGEQAGPLASSSSLWAAILAMPIRSGMHLCSPFLRLCARGAAILAGGAGGYQRRKRARYDRQGAKIRYHGPRLQGAHV